MHSSLLGNSSSKSVSSGNFALIVSSVLYVIVSVISTIWMYKELHALKSFPFFVNTLNTVSIILVCLVFAFLLIPFVHYRISKATSLKISALHATRGLLLHRKTIFLLGGLNGLQNTLMILCIDRLDNEFSNILVVAGQSVIPFTLLIAWIIRGCPSEYYTKMMLLGPFIICVGVAVSVFSSSQLNSLNHIDIIWVIVYILSTIPQALFFVLVESAFEKESIAAEIDDAEANLAASTSSAWVTAEAVVASVRNLDTSDVESDGLMDETVDSSRAVARSQRLRRRAEQEARRSVPGVLMRISLLVALVNSVSVPVNIAVESTYVLTNSGFIGLQEHFSNDYSKGAKCLFSSKNVHCQQSLALVLQFSPLGAAFIVGALILVNYGTHAGITGGNGALISFLTSAFSLPLQNFFLSIPWIMGGKGEAGISPISCWGGLSIVCTGLLIFAYGANKEVKGS